MIKQSPSQAFGITRKMAAAVGRVKRKQRNRESRRGDGAGGDGPKLFRSQQERRRDEARQACSVSSG